MIWVKIITTIASCIGNTGTKYSVVSCWLSAQVRERGGAGVGGAKGRAGLSDDDKIRLQLYVDVMYFARFVNCQDNIPDEGSGGGTETAHFRIPLEIKEVGTRRWI